MAVLFDFFYATPVYDADRVGIGRDQLTVGVPVAEDVVFPDVEGFEQKHRFVVSWSEWFETTEFVDALPTTATGKVQRHVLEERDASDTDR